jgi:hypothetical protein
MIRQGRCLKLVAAAVIAVVLGATDPLSAQRPFLRPHSLYKAGASSKPVEAVRRWWFGESSTWGAQPPAAGVGSSNKQRPLRELLRPNDLWWW